MSVPLTPAPRRKRNAAKPAIPLPPMPIMCTRASRRSVGSAGASSAVRSVAKITERSICRVRIAGAKCDHNRLTSAARCRTKRNRVWSDGRSEARSVNQSSPPSVEQPVADAETRADRLRAAFSRASLVVAIALLAATFLLLSPPRGQTYPGAIPWSDLSILRPLTELLSLGGLVATARGVEIKQLALHVACVLGLLVVVGTHLVPARQRGLVAQAAAAVVWAGSFCWPGGCYSRGSARCGRAIRRHRSGQAALYGLALLWALGLAWTLDTRHVPWLLAALVIVSAVASILCIWYYPRAEPAPPSWVSHREPGATGGGADAGDHHRRRDVGGRRGALVADAACRRDGANGGGGGGARPDGVVLPADEFALGHARAGGGAGDARPVSARPPHALGDAGRHVAGDRGRGGRG